MSQQEKMRQARLKALGLTPDGTDSASGGKSASPRKSSELKHPRLSVTRKPMETQDFQQVYALMCNGGGASSEDMLRWFEQGFTFGTNPSFGLKQGIGGPCGILAAVQAEIIREMFCQPGVSSIILNPSEEEIEKLLIKALSCILHRAANSNETAAQPLIKLIDVRNSVSNELSSSSSSTSSDHMDRKILTHEDLSVISLESPEDLEVELSKQLNLYHSRFGCVIFLMSLIMTRGTSTIKQDMDDESNTLIGQFGHCNQDLINLLLAGKATSNVLDGSVPLGDTGLLIKGIDKRASIGYLTQLEALRYCQVGSYFKVPYNAVWVIGSTSHFTVLFSLTNEANEESKSEQMLSMLQRCFKAVDIDECGYIPAERLSNVLELVAREDVTGLDVGAVRDILRTDIDLARLRGHIQIDGEIILWSSFWSNISKLLSGGSLDSIITISIVDSTLGLPATQEQGRERSDSQIARDMQAEIDNEGALPALEDFNVFPAGAGDSRYFPPSQGIAEEGAGRPRSDSEVARALQAEWDSEDSGGLATAVPPLGDGDLVTSPVPSQDNEVSSASNPDAIADPIQTRQELHRHDSVAGEEDDCFVMYHFNGLESSGRAAQLTKFKLYTRSAVDSVGHEVTFTAENGTAYLSGTGEKSIEEVLRTRWPGCRIDWLSNAVPSID